MTSEKVYYILNEFMKWMEHHENRTAGGREEQWKHARIILNDIEREKWPLNNYIIRKKSRGKRNGDPYKDTTLKALENTTNSLFNFNQYKNEIISTLLI